MESSAWLHNAVIHPSRARILPSPRAPRQPLVISPRRILMGRSQPVRSIRTSVITASALPASRGMAVPVSRHPARSRCRPRTLCINRASCRSQDQVLLPLTRKRRFRHVPSLQHRAGSVTAGLRCRPINPCVHYHESATCAGRTTLMRAVRYNQRSLARVSVL